MLKSHKMKKGWMKNDEGWRMNDEGWWFQAVVEGFQTKDICKWRVASITEKNFHNPAVFPICEIQKYEKVLKISLP